MMNRSTMQVDWASHGNVIHIKSIFDALRRERISRHRVEGVARAPMKTAAANAGDLNRIWASNLNFWFRAGGH